MCLEQNKYFLKLLSELTRTSITVPSLPLLIGIRLQSSLIFFKSVFLITYYLWVTWFLWVVESGVSQLKNMFPLARHLTPTLTLMFWHVNKISQNWWAASDSSFWDVWELCEYGMWYVCDRLEKEICQHGPFYHLLMKSWVNKLQFEIMICGTIASSCNSLNNGSKQQV